MSTTFLTIADLAKRYRITPKTVYNLRQAGKLPKPLKLGRLCRWKLADLEVFETSRGKEAGHE